MIKVSGFIQIGQILDPNVIAFVVGFLLFSFHFRSHEIRFNANFKIHVYSEL